MALSIDEAKALVIEFCATYPVAKKVSYKLRETQEELYGPQATRENVGGILGSFRPGIRQADFATSNFRDSDEFKDTLRHEILGHFGINTFTPAEKRAVLDGIIAARDVPGMADFWAEVDRVYSDADDSLKAEEVFAFACEPLNQQTRGDHVHGNRVFIETCIERSRPMRVNDLISITAMVAEGMRDGTRTQQNFPESDNAQFKREQSMESKKPFHEIVAERLIEQLKQGTAPWQMPWKAGDGGGMMPFNPTTGKRYKGINAIHLLSQGREDQRWLTYNQAKAEGAQVRKGEKSTSIQYWKFEEEQTKRDENNKPVLDGNGDPVKVRVRLERPKMFMANVFNAEQIDGLPAYQRPVQTWSAIERAETILQASGADIRHGGDRAYYRPSTDNIQMPNREQFPSADNYYATALHELGHWTGHGSRLDRDLSHPFGSEGYAKEELRAEIASMILGDELGIGHDPGQHASYVQSWIKALQNDPMEIFRAASDAEKIQTFVLGLEQQQIQTQEQSPQFATTQPAPVPQSWTHAACQAFDRMTAIATGEPNTGRTTHMARSVSEYDQMHFEPSAREQAFIEKNKAAMEETRQWLLENVRLNPEVKAQVYETVRDLGRVTGISATDDAEHLAYMAEMQPKMEPQSEQVASMQLPAPQPNIQAEEWALRAIERADLDQVVRRMTPDQLDTFYNVVSGMQPLGNDNEFWTRRETAMEAMFNDVDTVADRIDRALAIIGDESDRRVDVANRDKSQEAATQPVEAVAEQPAPELAPHEKMVATALINVRSEQDPILKESFGQLLSATSAQALGYQLPGDWSGETQVAGIATDPDGQSVSMVQGDQVPEFYGLYARNHEGLATWLADYETEAQAKAQADRLEAISLYSQVDESQLIRPDLSVRELDAALIEKVISLDAQFMELSRVIDDYRSRGDHDAASVVGSESGMPEIIHMLKTARTEAGLTDFDVLRRKGDLRETDTEVDAQEFWDDTRQYVLENNPREAHLANLGPEPKQGERWIVTEDMQRVVYAIPLQQQQVADQSRERPAERTYVSVPFKEKEQARELGAKWDRQEKSWYIPDGVDKGPFEHWLNPAPKVEQSALEQGESQEQGEVQAEAPRAAAVPKASREYLAVPYGERAAAKAAGAAWDKVAKSWYVGADGDAAALARWKPENVPNEQSPALDVREEFADAMRSVGLVVRGEHPIMDGKKHRVPVEGGRKGATDGFYVAFLDGHPAGSIINNKTGVNIKWKSKGYTLTDEQKAALQAEAASKLQARDAELLKTHETVATRVARQMESLVPVVELTPYMEAKGIQSLSGVLTDKAGKETVIPAIDVDGKQWTAQYIQQDGTKRFAKDGRKEGCFHPLGGLEAVAAAPVLVIAEGYATASTLASTLGHATVAAFDSGNLPAVAKALHEKFPDKPIVIAGDDDRHQVMSHGTNAGRTKAVEAAKVVGGKAIFPTFAPGEVEYPQALPTITPQAYRKHTQASGELKALISEGGPDAGNPAQSPRAAELRAEMLTDEQIAALEKMKRLTDFNDLATKSALGKEGLERQVKNAVGRVIEQHQVKVQQPQQERVQGVKRTEDEQQPKVRRSVSR